MIADRMIGGRYYGFRYPVGLRIDSDGHALYVENRDLYAEYILRDDYGRVILRHAVRNPEPLPIRPAQIIHVRYIPWFMWIYYGVRDAIRSHRKNRELKEWAEEDEARREAIRKAVKDRGMGRFGGRYNR